MKLAAFLILPLFAGLVVAQTPGESKSNKSTSAKTTLNGMLVDATCQSERKDKAESKSDQNTVDCPVNATTSSFGMVTSDGRFVDFDDASNARVVQMVKGNPQLTSGDLVQVRATGTEDGKVVIQSLTPVETDK